MRSSASWNLAAWYLISPASSVAAASFGLHAFALAARANTGICGGDASLAQCGKGLPSDFCCPQQTQCIALNNTGTDAVICCPNGNSCNTIQTITCDITLQDPTKYPSASVHVGDLTKALPTCGAQCCPLGFACETGTNGPFCQMKNETKTIIPSTSTLSSSISTPISSTTITSATRNPTLLPASSSRNRSPAKFIVAGVIPSLFAVAGIVFCCLFWKRRKIKKSQISEPIYEPQQAVRTDFLNRTRGPQQPGSQRPSLTEARPATSDTSSTAPLTQIKPIAPLQVRTVYPPPQPPSTQNQNRISRPGSTGTIGTLMPLGAEYYGPRYLPSMPAVNGNNGAATKRGKPYRLPTGMYQPYQPGG